MEIGVSNRFSAFWRKKLNRNLFKNFRHIAILVRQSCALRIKARCIFLLKFDYLEFKTRVGKISETLNAKSKAVEPDFLQLGEQLQAVFSLSTGLHKQILDHVKIFDEQSDESILVNVRERVEQSLDGLKKYQTEVGGKIHHISKIRDELSRIYNKCESFNQTNMYIRVVGLNIGIESTRSEAAREMFTVVSRQIRGVAQKMDQLNRTILDELEKEQDKQAAAFKEISLQTEHLAGLAKDGEQAARQAVIQIEKLIDMARKAFKDSGETSSEIAKQIGDIVQGIQFHDSMNQRIDHISTALKDVETMCHGRTKGRESPDTKSTLLTKIHAVLDIQKAQLTRIIAEIDALYKDNRQTFKKIKGSVSDLAETFPEFKNREHEKPATREAPVSNLMRVLQQLQDIHQKVGEQSEKIGATASHVSAAAIKLSDHLKSIQKISLETRNMALNAIVNAAHLGEKGRTHEVLAQEMMRLSNLSNRFSEDVKKLTDPVIVSAEKLNHEKGETQSTEPLMLNSSVEGSVAEISAAYDSLTDGSAQVLQLADNLKETISRIAENLNFLPSLSESLTEELGAIEAAKGLLRLRAGNENRTDVAKKAEILSERYTMKKERVIHEQILGTENQAVKMFAENQDSESAEVQQDPVVTTELVVADDGKKEADLGENIELF